jgi:hypothetical protein
MRRYTKPDTRLSLAPSGCPPAARLSSRTEKTSVSPKRPTRSRAATFGHLRAESARIIMQRTRAASSRWQGSSPKGPFSARTAGHGSDLADIERFISDDPGDRRKSRLAAATWALVERHRSRIERLAAMLRACGTLSGSEIDRIFDTSRPEPDAL